MHTEPAAPEGDAMPSRLSNLVRDRRLCMTPQQPCVDRRLRHCRWCVLENSSPVGAGVHSRAG